MNVRGSHKACSYETIELNLRQLETDNKEK